MPADLDPAARGEILEAFSVAASSIEENPMSIEASLASGGGLPRQPAMPHRAILSLVGSSRRGVAKVEPISQRRALAMELWTELMALPGAMNRRWRLRPGRMHP